MALKDFLTALNVIEMKMYLMISQLHSQKGHLLLDMVIDQALWGKVRIKNDIVLWIDDNPPPTTYNYKSDFDRTSPHGRAFSFGIAREAYSKVYIKENPVADKSIPGPGTYTVPPKIGNEASKYTLKGRTTNHRKLFTLFYLSSLVDNRQIQSRARSLRSKDLNRPTGQIFRSFN